MPELPEVETMVRVLAAHLLARELPGHGRLASVWRHGKVAVLDFSGLARANSRLVARLGMTGTFRLGGDPGPYTRQTLPFGGLPLHFDDIRRFGRLQWQDALPPIGPDVFSLPRGEFAALLAGRDRRIKALLLDQMTVSGLGNIYCDECLHRAGIHPLTPASAIDGQRLHRVIRETLAEAIADGGSTISDFVDPLGRAGRFQERHRVYGRAGKPCPQCATPIVRVVAAQRGTHYCPACQPLWPPENGGSHRPNRRRTEPRLLPSSG